MTSGHILALTLFLFAFQTAFSCLVSYENSTRPYFSAEDDHLLALNILSIVLNVPDNTMRAHLEKMSTLHKDSNVLPKNRPRAKIQSDAARFLLSVLKSRPPLNKEKTDEVRKKLSEIKFPDKIKGIASHRFKNKLSDASKVLSEMQKFTSVDFISKFCNSQKSYFAVLMDVEDSALKLLKDKDFLKSLGLEKYTSEFENDEMRIKSFRDFMRLAVEDLGEHIFVGSEGVQREGPSNLAYLRYHLEYDLGDGMRKEVGEYAKEVKDYAVTQAKVAGTAVKTHVIDPVTAKVKECATCIKNKVRDTCSCCCCCSSGSSNNNNNTPSVPQQSQQNQPSS